VLLIRLPEVEYRIQERNADHMRKWNAHMVARDGLLLLLWIHLLAEAMNLMK
jgi:hypothetical protein